MANLMALALAREVHLRALRGLDREPRGAALEDVRVYASDQTHFSVARGLDVLGFPPETLHVLPSDERFRLQAAPVAEAIASDRAAGRTPLAISAVAGSTNTGSVDDVPALAALAADHGLWLHVDAAYGGAARLSARDAGRVPGLELADSVTVDPHKWFFQAYDIGALLVRRREDLLRDLLARARVLRVEPAGGRAAQLVRVLHRGHPSVPRAQAVDELAAPRHRRGSGGLIEHNDDLAAYLADRIGEAPDFDLACRAGALDRVLPPSAGGRRGMDGASTLDAYQTALQRALEVDGTGWVSVTSLRGRTYLRAGVRELPRDRAPTSMRCSRRFAGCQKASSNTSTAVEPSGRSHTLATSNRTLSGTARTCWRKTSASARSFCRLRTSTASNPPPKRAPRRVLTSQITRVCPRASTRSSSPTRHRQLRATTR